jgi:hypothetical protein
MYMCMSVNTDMYIHKYMHVSIKTFKHIYMPVYVYICMYNKEKPALCRGNSNPVVAEEFD